MVTSLNGTNVLHCEIDLYVTGSPCAVSPPVSSDRSLNCGELLLILRVYRVKMGRRREREGLIKNTHGECLNYPVNIFQPVGFKFGSFLVVIK